MHGLLKVLSFTASDRYRDLGLSPYLHVQEMSSVCFLIVTISS